ncbi:MAG: 3'-5' exonuclease [Bacteroidales bacterium]|jgi:DNA polymerase-3 subunit epsilon|nr:3'-5' exonuclease [Bacteroidales bacterium]MDI9576229.1 3'-5' exonuclease [Bacteroidota bacterium]MDD3756053.1 3'-5' exonuclease [Bacteroidales bacterium]MDY0401448.1 3'-5' exonuclease [Bacteroidales bacterium]HOB78208.1 3'-5' exonuclease [Bacteroidales bacterium]
MKLLLERPIIFFDLEATGLDLVNDKILEIFMLKVNPDGSTDTYEQLFNPEIPIPPEVTQITGITEEMVRNKPTFREKAQEIADFIDNADIAGFNSNKFDIPLLAEELLNADVDIDFTNRNAIDVMVLFHRMEPRNLTAAYKYYCNKELQNAHTAKADTIATYEILLGMLERYIDDDNIVVNNEQNIKFENDVKKLSQLSKYYKFADLAGHILYDENDKEVFNFGKYKGKVVEEVFKIEPQYYDWIMKAQFPRYTKKIVDNIWKKIKDTNIESE